MSGFTSISSRNELADYLGIPRKKLTHILYVIKVDNLYKSFEIPKKNGGMRQINAPSNTLKNIQMKLAETLWEHQKDIWQKKKIRPNISHAFEENKNIITNARIHKNKRFVLNIDLENYFDSFHFGRVRGFFAGNKNFKVPIEVATVIAQISCYNGCLPQGAPSSPIITNLISQILDKRLLKKAKEYRLDYTRYADDLTFSTNKKDFLENYQAFIQDLSNEIENAGFKINNKKTRLQFRDSKQVVTGLTVNQKLNVDKRFYKDTRAMAHNLYSKGVFYIDGKKGNINQLEGRFSYINQLERYNNKQEQDRNRGDKKKHCFYNLNGREEQYRKLLFYKYFFSNDKPVIVTEGKTDISYIKSALKNLYAYYPGLISKTGRSNYEFKITFLKRSRRLSHFFGISQDGADAMKNIFNCYTGKNGLPNYIDYFKRISSAKPNRPVILLFDNEMKSGKKPLKSFVNTIGVDEDKRISLSSNLGINIISNLFLLTNPLVKSMPECEIEDLFNDDTLSYTIGGKSFSRDSNFDSSKFYGKEIFSKYISRNYKDIDFSEFKPLLEKLNDMVNNYVPI